MFRIPSLSSSLLCDEAKTHRRYCRQIQRQQGLQDIATSSKQKKSGIGGIAKKRKTTVLIGGNVSKKQKTAGNTANAGKYLSYISTVLVPLRKRLKIKHLVL